MKNKLRLILVVLIGLFVLISCQSQYIRTAKLAVRDKNDPEKSIKNLEQEIKQNPENADAYLLLSKIYGQYKKDYVKSFQYAKKAVEIDPSKEPGALAIYTTCWAQLHNQGLDKFEEEEFSAALKFFHKANEIFPDSLVTEKMIANSYVRLDSLEKAKDVYVSIIESNPKDVKSREALASIYYNNGDYETAIKYYKELKELEPNKINWPYNIAVCYSTMEEHNEALNYYKKALSYEPENKKLLHKIAATEFNNESYENSAMYYKKIMELDANDSEALEFITRSYNFLKDWQNVKKYAKQWKQVVSDSETARLFVNLANQKSDRKEVRIVNKQKQKNKHKKPDFPPLIVISEVSFKDANGDNFLETNESGELKIKLKNQGRGIAYNLSARIKPKKEEYKFLDYSKNVTKSGKFEPGSEKYIKFSFYTKLNTPSMVCKFIIEFNETNDFHPDSIEFSFETKHLDPPNFIVEKEFEDYDGNFKIEPLEIVEVNTYIINKGGKAKNVSLKLENDKNTFFTADSKKKYFFNSIRNGENKEISFSFYTNKNVGEKANITISLKSSNYRKEFKLGFDISRKKNLTQKITIKGKDKLNREKEGNLNDLIIDIEKNIPKTKEDNKYGVAVIIGNKNYQKIDVPDVKYAIRDAHFIKKYLIQSLGYREGNIIFIHNATQGNFYSLFGNNNNFKGKLYNYVKKGKSDIFIYYSGHGAPDPESNKGFFVPVDCDPSLVFLNGYSLNTFYGNLSKIDYKSLTVVIDACFSGSSEDGMLLKNISPVSINIDIPIIAKENTNVFTSSTGNQVSSWYTKKKHSLFTYYFLKALGGEADINRNKEITFGELNNFINDNVPYMARRLNNRVQTPQFFGEEDRVFFNY